MLPTAYCPLPTAYCLLPTAYYLAPAVAFSIFAVWLFALGGAVGSFLNVVIYRLPAGKSLVWPGSHCPACQHPIRWHDNVPILSWFLLRGRCRDCAAKISVRYPLVEAITAALFVLVGVVEGLSGGANLPLEPTVAIDGVVFPPLGVGQSAGIAAYHLLLLCTLLAAALIEHDGHRLPAKLLWPAIVVGCLTPMIWPGLHPVRAFAAFTGPVGGAVDAAAGGLAGLVLGELARRLTRASDPLSLLILPTCVGLFLGWQAVLVLTGATAVVHLASLGARRLRPGLRSVSPTAWLAVFTLGWVLAWGWIVRRWPVLG